MENNTNIPDSFDLPDDYFKSSKLAILNKMEWISEHKAYPVLSVLKDQHGFIVPENYFNANSAQLELLDTPVLKTVSKENPFATPDSYFNSSVSDLKNKIDSETELNAFKLLSSLKDEYPLQVSENYFSENKKQIQLKLNAKGGARIISLNRKTLWYAAAAVLTITVGLWIYQSFFNTGTEVDNCNTLACIEKRELLKYKLDNIDSEELYEMVNADKLLQNLTKKETTDSLSTNDSIDASLMDYIE